MNMREEWYNNMNIGLNKIGFCLKKKCIIIYLY